MVCPFIDTSDGNRTPCRTRCGSVQFVSGIAFFCFFSLILIEKKQVDKVGEVFFWFFFGFFGGYNVIV